MSREKRERRYILKRLAWSLVSIPFFYFGLRYFSEAPGLIYLIVPGGLILSIVVASLKNMKKNIDREIEWDTSAEKRREEHDAIASGTWEFPEKELYLSCKAVGIETLESSYSKSKVKALADEIMRNNNIFQSFWPLYDSDERLEAYFYNGKGQWEQEQKRNAEKERIYKSTAHAAEINEEQRAELAFLNDLKACSGTAKRKAMLDLTIKKINSQICKLMVAEKNMQELGFITAQSAVQTKSLDAAVVAGLANGLGGAGAAFYAAAEAMNHNAGIEAENRRNREAVNRMAAGIYSDSFALGSDIDILEKEQKLFEKARDELRTKVVIECADTQELFKSLSIEEAVVEKTETGALSVKTSIKSSFAADVPEQVKTTIDGTLIGKVYAGDLFVGECILPLPMFGVECGNPDPAAAETLCGSFAANALPYRVEFTPNKLWVMEL